MNKVHSPLPTALDIDWDAIEREVKTKQVNMKGLCERYGRGVTQPTFKSWLQDKFAGKYRIDFGRQGRNNYIRFLPHATEDTLLRQLMQLEKQYGRETLLTAMIQFAVGDKQ